MQTEATEPVPHFADVSVDLRVEQLFSYRIPDDEAIPRIVPGRVVQVPFGRRKLWGVVRSIGARAPKLKRIREISKVLPDPYVLDRELLDLCDWLATYYACSAGEAYSLALPPQPGTRAREKFWREEGAQTAPETPPELKPAQRDALEAIRAASGDALAFLLHGVTGSGKTEVYLRAIRDALDRGQSALVLLPEIALTPQTLRRLQRRFPGEVAPYHSKLSHGERCAVWEAAARGELRVVVGARSAALLPLKRLGLIIVDEEHEGSFKSDQRPRQHARDVVLMRGRRLGVPVVLGSATPSLESWSNARSGKFQLLSLPERIGAGELPTIRVVDRRVRDGERGYGLLTPELTQALERTLDAGKQAIVFHNRRGFARYLQCESCGEVVECPNCDISLTYHLTDDRLHCHYCALVGPVPGNCPECSAQGLRTRGSGTQRIELAVQSRFPEARVLRLDLDSTRRKESHAEILEQFGRGDADILLGTQMVAKGLHFPGVALVGVVDADAGLHFPDFRAHERAFQLLTQVSGRSGRNAPGEVVLQSFDPEHRVLQRVLAHEVEEFLAEELSQRELLGYPPQRRLSAVGASCTDPELLDQALERLCGQLRRDLSASGVEVLGPARSAIGRINRRHRGQILLKGGLSEAGKLQVRQRLEELPKSLRGGSRIELHLDVDPLQLL